MSVENTYPIEVSVNKLIYTFESKGENGIIKKIVVFQKMEEDKFNLGFGDEIKGNINDEIVSNNNDMIQVLSTLAVIIYDFTTHFPNSRIIIRANERRRLILYNAIFRRRVEEIKENFEVIGVKEGKRESYSSTEFYYKFEIKRKK